MHYRVRHQNDVKNFPLISFGGEGGRFFSRASPGHYEPTACTSVGLRLFEFRFRRVMERARLLVSAGRYTL